MNLPWFVSGFMKLITPFIDPLTRKKLVYGDDLRNHVPPSQLLKSHGGDVEFEYKHEEYWPALNSLADQRLGEIKARWVQGGKRVGELEAYLKGGQQDSLAGLIAKDEQSEREKRPQPERSGTNRSGGLRVERADGDEQRPRKSVSIYDGREGHEDDKTSQLTNSPPRAEANNKADKHSTTVNA